MKRSVSDLMQQELSQLNSVGGQAAAEYLKRKRPEKRQKTSASGGEVTLNPGREVVLGNCGGFLALHGGDEFMLGAGFRQSSAFTQPLSEEAQKYH